MTILRIILVMVVCIAGCKDERPNPASEGMVWVDVAEADKDINFYNGTEWVDIDASVDTVVLADDAFVDSDEWHTLTAARISEPTDLMMSFDGIDVKFSIEDGKFNIEYDPDKVTESARVFFEVLIPYFSKHYVVK